jgi:hypothetical protein
MENITLSEQVVPEVAEKKEILLTDVPVNSENDALNVLIGFLVLAQRKGTFSFVESAKIFECIKVFQKPSP